MHWGQHHLLRHCSKSGSLKEVATTNIVTLIAAVADAVSSDHFAFTTLHMTVESLDLTCKTLPSASFNYCMKVQTQTGLQ